MFPHENHRYGNCDGDCGRDRSRKKYGAIARPSFSLPGSARQARLVPLPPASFLRFLCAARFFLLPLAALLGFGSTSLLCLRREPSFSLLPLMGLLRLGFAAARLRFCREPGFFLLPLAVFLFFS